MSTLAPPVGGLVPVRLVRSEDADEASALLYSVYFQELGWDPVVPNPSRLVADHATRRFRDRFDGRATWLGLRTTSGELVATLRLIAANGADGAALEIESYLELPDALLDHAVEVNRVAVHPDYRHDTALSTLYQAAWSEARNMGAHSAIGASSEEVVYGVAFSLGWRPEGISFRYHPTDPEEAHVMTHALAAGE